MEFAVSSPPRNCLTHHPTPHSTPMDYKTYFLFCLAQWTADSSVFKCALCDIHCTFHWPQWVSTQVLWNLWWTVQCTLLCADLSTCSLHRRREKTHEHNCFQRGATWGSPETETRRHAVPGSSFSQAHRWMWFQLMLEHTIHLKWAHSVYHAMYEVHSEDSTKKTNGILWRGSLFVVDCW